MSLEQNKETVRGLIDAVWNRHRPEALEDYLTGDLLPEVAEHVGQFLTAFPDVRVTIEDLIAEGDRVSVRLVVRGTNLGSFAGHPPSGKPVEFGSFRMYRLESGRIVETWAMQDRLGLMEQLGLGRSPESVNWAAGRP